MRHGGEGKTKTVFYCHQCGHRAPKWLGRCPSCGDWHTFVEEPAPVVASAGRPALTIHEPPRSIASLSAEDTLRLKTGMTEMDRVLGGGLVVGSTILVGGEPGIGKSTLLLQLLQGLAARGMTVLYVSGEESAKQIKLRGERVGADAASLLVLVEISLE
ncbi:MAG: AAA family ATPase, partial [Syntrophales bacterium]|nr:AAA family ATPase [Syntrophales bacterium]